MQTNEFDELKEYERQRAMETISGFTNSAEAIINSVKEVHNLITIDDFERELLPTYRSWVSGQETPDIGLWVQNAGGPYKEMGVVDNRKDRNILFFLPAPFTNSSPVLMTIDEKSLHSRTTLHQLIEKQSLAESVGDQRTNAMIEKNIPTLFEFEMDQRVRQNYILKHYNIYKTLELPFEELFPNNTQAWVNACEEMLTGKKQSTTHTTPNNKEFTEDEVTYTY